MDNIVIRNFNKVLEQLNVELGLVLRTAAEQTVASVAGTQFTDVIQLTPLTHSSTLTLGTTTTQHTEIEPVSPIGSDDEEEAVQAGEVVAPQPVAQQKCCCFPLFKRLFG